MMMDMAVQEASTRFREQELERNLRAVENAVAQQELEGLTVSPEAVMDMYSVARGEMTSEQAIANVHTRLHDATLLRR